MQIYINIYHNCTNYWCDKLSYRLAIVCELGGRSKNCPKKFLISAKSYVLSYRSCFQLSFHFYEFKFPPLFFYCKYTVNKFPVLGKSTKKNFNWKKNRT